MFKPTKVMKAPAVGEWFKSKLHIPTSPKAKSSSRKARQPTQARVLSSLPTFQSFSALGVPGDRVQNDANIDSQVIVRSGAPQLGSFFFETSNLGLDIAFDSFDNNEFASPSISQMLFGTPEAIKQVNETPKVSHRIVSYDVNTPGLETDISGNSTPVEAVVSQVNTPCTAVILWTPRVNRPAVEKRESIAPQQAIIKANGFESPVSSLYCIAPVFEALNRQYSLFKPVAPAIANSCTAMVLYKNPNASIQQLADSVKIIARLVVDSVAKECAESTQYKASNQGKSGSISPNSSKTPSGPTSGTNSPTTFESTPQDSDREDGSCKAVVLFRSTDSVSDLVATEDRAAIKPTKDVKHSKLDGVVVARIDQRELGKEKRGKAHKFGNEIKNKTKTDKDAAYKERAKNAEGVKEKKLKEEKVKVTRATGREVKQQVQVRQTQAVTVNGVDQHHTRREVHHRVIRDTHVHYELDLADHTRDLQFRRHSDDFYDFNFVRRDPLNWEIKYHMEDKDEYEKRIGRINKVLEYWLPEAITDVIIPIWPVAWGIGSVTCRATYTIVASCIFFLLWVAWGCINAFDRFVKADWC